MIEIAMGIAVVALLGVLFVAFQVNVLRKRLSALPADQNVFAILKGIDNELSRLDAVTAALFRETTTIGFRVSAVDRRVADREQLELDTPYGSLQVKVARYGGSLVNVAPEACRVAPSLIRMMSLLRSSETPPWTLSVSSDSTLYPSYKSQFSIPSIILTGPSKPV